MNTPATLFYFTGTGNSLQVARDLARELGNTQVVAMPEAWRDRNTTASGCIGLVFPVYCWGMPRLVRRFAADVAIENVTYAFAVCTYAGGFGNTLIETADALDARGVRLDAGFGVKMPGNYVPMQDIWPQEKQQKTFAVAREKVREIAATVKNREQRAPERHWPAINWIARGVRAVMVPRLPASDVKFSVDATCNGCGVCERICPVHNIQITKGKPAWLHNCEQCLACLHWCPQRAIQFGRLTRRRGRYHHPGVTLPDMMPKPPPSE